MSTPVVSIGEYRALTRKPRKYRNTPMRIDGVRFDSKAEAKRYHELLLLQSAGAITGLMRQPRFTLDVLGEHIGDYVADFQYYERGARVVEDVKSPPTRTPLYRWKVKHLKAQHGIEVREV